MTTSDFAPLVLGVSLLEDVRAHRLDAVNVWLASEEPAVDLNARDDQGCTALWIAAHEGLTGVVRELLDLGAQMSLCAVDGETPLHAAARMGHLATVRLLLDRGASLDALDETQQTPLHVASFTHQAEVVALLLERGANPQVADQDGDLPLDLALMQEPLSQDPHGEAKTATVERLILRGAESRPTVGRARAFRTR